MFKMKVKIDKEDFERMVKFCEEQGAIVVKNNQVVWVWNPDLEKILKLKKDLVVR